ncbi:MAG TPA: 4-hydroxy-3-methylbut-2-enyl diphosphate reductase [Caulobacteraceae bacterium]|jgi:4-hydroxy-3-methylbut-2-enyl diphosphate reductase|nr:4-hydroxy-3-methylbut-2-enyl diphosphate reductase [Caulobacteraceae bacterium]
MRRNIKVLLASPRGFCAGVDRAIQIVERAIEKYGAPVYVRHEIVHNKHVVDRLRAVGAVFVEELEECPDDRPVVFSAHGVPKSVPAEAEKREMIYLDATCPLVSKVHVEAERHYAAGREIVLIGHNGHPEVVGTMGQLPAGAVALIQTVAEAETFTPRDPGNLAFVTQTTLSLEDTAEMVDALRRRFPQIAAPHKEDICYATTNRQDAVKAMAERCDLLLVVGARNSSNSVRLVEVGLKAGARDAKLIDEAANIDWRWFEGVKVLGLTAGASAPELLVQGVLGAMSEHFDIEIEEIATRQETVTFKLPRAIAPV